MSRAVAAAPPGVTSPCTTTRLPNAPVTAVTSRAIPAMRAARRVTWVASEVGEAPARGSASGGLSSVGLGGWFDMASSMGFGMRPARRRCSGGGESSVLAVLCTTRYGTKYERTSPRSSVSKPLVDPPAGARSAMSRDRVLRGALAVADRGGLAGLTIRSLAAELGVKPMTVYYYVANKEEILDGLVDLVFSEIELPTVGGDWRAEISRRAHPA